MSKYFIAVFPRITTDIHLRDPSKTKASSRGYDHTRKRNHKTLLTDAQVLEARWLWEYGGWSPARVGQHYKLSASYCSNLLAYAARGKIVPDKDSFPAGHVPKPFVSLQDLPKD